MTEFQKAYQEWVATSKVSNTPEYRAQSREYAARRRDLLEERPTIRPEEMDAELSKFRLVHRENLKDCCMNSHYKKTEIGTFEELPDEDVCERERAWRKYCRLRDESLRREMN